MKLDNIDLYSATLARVKKDYGGKLAGRAQLHKAILGPPGSGRTTLAQDYARDLMHEGMIQRPPVIVDLSQPLSDIQISFYFNEAENGVIILENPHATTRQETLQGRIGRLVENNSGICVITGERDETEAWMAGVEELATLRRAADFRLATEKTLSDAEKESFHKNAPVLWQARERERHRKAVIESWKGAVVDVTAGRPLKAPPRARFTKDNGQ